MPKKLVLPKLDDLSLSTGKKARLYRLMYERGLKNGTLLLMPIDQGLEHGPRDFFDNPESADPEFQLRLTLEGGYNGIVFQIGVAEKYMPKYAGRVPLVLKLNGKTEIPGEDPLSPQLASVKDAVRLGADAIGYTLYVGTPKQTEDFIQFGRIREEAERYGMPIIVWAYPRGKYVEAKGGQDSLYAVEYAARVAHELGADIVKVNFPKIPNPKDADAPKPYNNLKFTPEEAIQRVVKAAQKTLVLISGGGKVSDEEVLRKATLSMQAGAIGLIFGRNMWQRKFPDAMKMTRSIQKMLSQFSR